ncbi:hypothetical protein SAMN05446037_100829 [Anaerovirgula multivorans]|uniref:BNR repeat-like domain-containing protein n=1 Tax=Anaerovirgula multivorans TaxID=312168 RepID=A0A239DLE5_9FIRM|nr:hypothetical protein [Anaerovirgula multivorans]SNS33266.1 hypothetical protein SAMN05446037_100829 [Anaerovirgula multivorans]
MGLVVGYEYIIKNSKGKLYNFYLNEKQQIEYIAKDEENRWAEKDIVFEEAINSFSVEIDELDSVHIVSYSKKRMIYYHTSVKNNWIHKNIKSYSTDISEIYYPVIKIIDKSINIFYYFHDKKDKSTCDLVHFVLNEESVWKSRNLFEINYNKFINPFYVLLKESGMYVLFTSLIGEFNQVFLTSFDHQLNEWQKPIQITQSPIEKIYIYGLIINRDTLHITWSEFDEKGLTVKYTKLCEKQFGEDSFILSLSEKSNCSFPILLSYNGLLWCTWTQMNKLYACYSKDEGNEWSFPTIRQESQQLEFKLYQYKTNYTDDYQNIICNYLYGSLYPKIQFLGFGGEIV